MEIHVLSPTRKRVVAQRIAVLVVLIEPHHRPTQRTNVFDALGVTSRHFHPPILAALDLIMIHDDVKLVDDRLAHPRRTVGHGTDGTPSLLELAIVDAKVRH